MYRRSLCAVLWLMSAAVVSADTLIYNNSLYQGYTFTPGAQTEIFDYGSSSGGLVKKFAFGYSSSSSISWARVTFYSNPQLNYLDPGYQVATFLISNLPASTGAYRIYEYVLPEEDRFELSSGSFGYSIILSSNSAHLPLASGGAGQQNKLWEYLGGWGWNDFWFGGSPWAGLYFKIYTAPPINEVTCDITGWKFNDANGNGVWDADEPAMTGWEFFLDINNDGIYQPSEPNAATDPNGFYMFKNVPSPATYRVREIIKIGWPQTLPGSAGNYQYLIATEPNTVYGPLNFGNTTMPQRVTLSGYVKKENGEPFVGIQVDLDLDGNYWIFEKTTVTDSQGRYSFSLGVPWTGTAFVRLPRGWISHSPLLHENITTNIIEDFVCSPWYDGGSGTLSSPYQIRTVEQLLLINTLQHLDKHFVLIGDIDLEGTVYSESLIGPSFYETYFPFSGTFNGSGYSIRNLKSSCGLFGYIRNAVIKNLGVENVEITGGGTIGAICSYNHGGTIDNCFSSGVIEGLFDVGGICGWTFREYKGDLPYIPGLTLPAINTPLITRCCSTAHVTIRYPENMMAQESWGTAGGLCGYAEDAQLNNNCTRGRIQGVGCISVWGSERNVRNGGLAGWVNNCIIFNNYSASEVVSGLPHSSPGGLCGRVAGADNIFVGNYWDIEVSGQASSAFGTPKSTAQMKTMSTFEGWNFADIWRICDGMNYPRLQWEPRLIMDFVCPEGVELADVIFMADQWLMTGVSSADIAPLAPDGKVNLLDFAELAAHWLEGVD
jgi:hypothetical protein